MRVDTTKPEIGPHVKRAQPFLQWVGGKRQVLDQILPRLPEFPGNYYEPFLGGGAMFFALEPRRAFLSDANVELITAYDGVQIQVDDVIRILRTYENTAETFYQTRAIPAWSLDRDGVAARMIYLNRTCFNGLYRVNAYGRFNTPYGKHKNPKICDEENLRAASEALRYASLSRGDFAKAVAPSGPGDLIYFDPPYTPVSASASFTAYTKGRFGWEDQRRLAEVFRAAASRGAFCALSQADLPAVRELYQGFQIHDIKARRSVNCVGAGRGVVREILVTSF